MKIKNTKKLLEEIQGVLKLEGLQDDSKLNLILNTLGNNEECIDVLMHFIKQRNSMMNNLFKEMNLKLSKAEVLMDKQSKFNKNDLDEESKEILKFYSDHHNTFNILGLPSHCFKDLKNVVVEN